MPEWIEIARAFDPEMANQHVEYLASPELAGRQAGSPGAEIAAAYIAARFAEYGLLPVGESAACERVEGRRYAGANDDASGVGVLLEIARLWHETGYCPQHSVLCQKIELPRLSGNNRVVYMVKELTPPAQGEPYNGGIGRI